MLKGLLGVTLAGFFTGGYAVGEAALACRVQRWAVAPAGWRRGQRLRVAMLADLHATGSGMDEERVGRIVDLVMAEQPDLIALMGDYRATHRFQRRAVRIEAVAPILARLSARLGVYAVLGNHDWWDDKAAMQARRGPVHAQTVLEAAGIPVLANRAVKLGQGEAAFWLGGTDSQSAFYKQDGKFSAGMADLPAVLAQIDDDAPALLLAHEPDQFADVPDRIALTLAGHSHGGQLRIGPWVPWTNSRFGRRYLYGHIREGGREMVVSGGLGCSTVPIRLGVPPEITVVDIA